MVRDRRSAILSAYDFSRFERIVDVGGGQGILLAGLLAASPQAHGLLYDLPNVVIDAEALRRPGIAERCEIIAGDLFESVPADGDAYILSRAIHHWEDVAALKILGNCRRVIRSDGRLLLVEGIAQPPNEPDPNKFLDVWFIGGGGCERNEEEFRKLLRAGGFRLLAVAHLDGRVALLNCCPD